MTIFMAAALWHANVHTKACGMQQRMQAAPMSSQTPILSMCPVQEEHMAETLSTCRFAQRMGQVRVDAVQNGLGLDSVHGNLKKLDPIMQQYVQVGCSEPQLQQGRWGLQCRSALRMRPLQSLSLGPQCKDHSGMLAAAKFVESVWRLLEACFLCGHP